MEIMKMCVHEEEKKCAKKNGNWFQWYIFDTDLKVIMPTIIWNNLMQTSSKSQTIDFLWKKEWANEWTELCIYGKWFANICLKFDCRYLM